MNIETVSTSQENANLKTWRDALLSPVLEDLEKRRGLSAEMILKLCPLRIQERESAKLPDAIKRRLARQPNHAFKIPYNNFDGENLTGVFRVRLLDGDEPKYVGPTGVPPHIYLPKGFHNWRSIQRDPSIPIVVVEGEIKSVVGCAFGLVCIGIPGVWSFKSKKTGDATLLPELEMLSWQGRKVIIAHDSDCNEKAGVKAALHALARELDRRGATVTTRVLPANTDGSKVGLDDFLLEHGREAFDTLDERQTDRDRTLQEFNRDFVRVLNQDENYELATGVRRDDRHFLSHTANRRFVDVMPSGKVKDSHGGEEWLKWEDRRSAQDYDFVPAEDLITRKGNLNLFRGLGVESLQGDVAPWNTILDHHFGKDDEGQIARRWFEQWAAYPFQHLGAKLFTAVLFWSRENGSGKSLIGEVVGAVYGDYFKEIKEKQFRSGFNTWADRKLFILANEIFSTDRRADIGAWKNLITEHEVAINAKFKNEISYRDGLNYMFTSQYPDALALEDKDRRIFVWRTERKLDPTIGKRIGDWARSEAGRAALLFHFQHVDLSGFDSTGAPPLTAAKLAMVEASRSDLDSKARDVVLEMSVDADDRVRRKPGPDDLTTAEYAAFRAGIEFGAKTHSPKAWGASLGRAGAEKYPKRIRVGVKRYWVWAVAHTEHWLEQTAKHVIAAFVQRAAEIDKAMIGHDKY